MLGQVFTVEILSLDKKGHGRAQVPDDARPLAVPASAPGDQGQVRIIHQSPHQLVGQWVGSPEGPNRYPDPCPHRPQCAGCVSWEVADEVLWQQKLAWVRQSLGHLSEHLSAGRGPAARGTWRSRHRVLVQRRAEELRFVVPVPRQDEPLAIDACPILHPALVDRLSILARQLQEPALATVISMVLTAGRAGHEPMAEVGIGLRATGPLPTERPPVGRPGDAIAWLEASGSPRAHFAGPGQARVYSGPALVAVPVGQRVLPTPPFAFVQVHPEGRLRLLETVLELAPSEPGQAMDAGCGTGFFARALARNGWQVTAMDDDTALAPAWAQAVPGVSFVNAPAGERPWPPGMDLVICDPPRSGLDPEWLERLLKARPRTVIMVHCGLAAARRDLHALAESGYRCAEIRPVDLMPGTMQVELVSAWEASHEQDSGSDGRG